MLLLQISCCVQVKMAEGFFPDDTFLSDVHIGTFEVPADKVGYGGGGGGDIRLCY